MHSQENVANVKGQRAPYVGKSATKQTPGCKTCARRRIKCDLGEPTCRKCGNKGLQCPGYGRNLKWVGGVAARGRLRPRAETKPAGLIIMAQGAVVPARTTKPIANPPIETQLFTDHVSAVLLDYYDKKIAGMMVWLDSDRNEYRRRAVPLAHSHPGLFFAITALSAHHGSSLLDNSESLSEYAHNKSLAEIQQFTQCLAQRLEDDQANGLDNETDIANVEWVLASSMIMSNYHMARSLPGASECHRRAARVFVNSFKSTKAQHSGFFKFLRNQLAICDVIVATTSFNRQNIVDTVTPSPDAGNEIFADFLSLLHQVTMAASQHLGGRDGTLLGGHPFTFASVRAGFEQARGATLLAAGRLQLVSGQLRRDFIRLVDVYHNAGMLYSVRVLGIGCLDETSVVQHDVLLTTIKQQLTEFEDRSMWAHNLPWPAFIAGVEAHGDAAGQTIVENLFVDIFNCTGFHHYVEALQFLRDFWHGSNEDWRPLAQQWEMAGRRLLLY